MGLSASIASGTAYLMMRIMGTALKDGVNPLYFGTFSSYASFLHMAIFRDPLVEEYDWFTIVGLFVMALLGFVAQMGVTKSLALEKAGRTAPLNYLQVVMAWIFDITCFGATAKWTDIVGTLFIVGFTLASAVYKGFINPKD